jgi:hypothetical protein
MGKTKIWIKNNMLFFISIITLIISIGLSINFISINRATSEGDETRLAHIYLGSDDNRYSSIISSSINQYKTNAKYELTYQGQSYEFDFDLAVFSLNETLDSINVGNNNLAFFTIDKTDLENDLVNIFGSNFISLVNMDALIQDLESNLSTLKYFKEINLYDYINENSLSMVLGQVNFSNVQVDILSQIDDGLIFNIDANKAFSILEKTVEMDFSKETYDFMSQAILNVSLESPFSHYQFMTENQADLEILISENNGLDFSFFNPYNLEFQLSFSKNGSNIQVQLIGPPLINTYTSEVRTIDLPYETIYENDSTLLDPIYMIEDTDTYTTYQKIDISGEDGELKQIIRHIETPSGETSTEILYYHRVQATNQIILENTVQKEGD